MVLSSQKNMPEYTPGCKLRANANFDTLSTASTDQPETMSVNPARSQRDPTEVYQPRNSDEHNTPRFDTTIPQEVSYTTFQSTGPTNPSHCSSENANYTHTLPHGNPKPNPTSVVPGYLGPQRSNSPQDASDASPRHEYLIAGSLPETMGKPTESCDGDETVNSKYIAKGSKWNQPLGSTQGNGVESEDGSGEVHISGNESRTGEQRSEIQVDTMYGQSNQTSHVRAAGNSEDDVRGSTDNKTPTSSFRTGPQWSNDHPLLRGYSSSPSHSSTNSVMRQVNRSPAAGLLPSYVSAFEYAIRPFLEEFSTHDDQNPLSLRTSTTDSITSISTSSVPSTAAPSSWSVRTNQLFSPPLLERELPPFLQGGTLEVQFHYRTLKTVLLRCAVLARLADGLQHGYSYVRRDAHTSRASSRIGSRTRSRVRSRSRNMRGNSRTSEQEAGEDEDENEDEKRETYFIYEKLHTLAFRVALPIADKFQDRELQARCWYWIGRAQIELGYFDNAGEAFERVVILGSWDAKYGLKGEERDVRFCLEKAKAMGAISFEDALKENTSDKSVDGFQDGKEVAAEPKPTPTRVPIGWREREFEDWEWEYIKHEDNRKWSDMMRRSTKLQGESALDEEEHTEHSTKVEASMYPRHRFQETVFSPLGRLFGSLELPPQETAQSIFAQESQGKSDADDDASSDYNSRVSSSDS